MKEKVDLSVDEILESVAHQWRQPLAQINSTVSIIDKILYEKNIEDEEIEKRLQEIEQITKFMSQTIDDFRGNFVNKEVKKSLSITQILQSSLETVQKSFEDNRIKILLDIRDAFECQSYGDDLKQIVVVLLHNAQDALLDRNTFNAEVGVKAFRSEDGYCITVSDNAGGISKSIQKKIFEPYYTTKHRSQGTGLGLFMARKMIQEYYNGSLQVKNFNKGTCFTIELNKEEDV